MNKYRIFCWILGHISIHGNDKTAKELLQLNPSTGKIPYTDLKPKINTYILRKCRELWSSWMDNKLHLVIQTIRVKSLNRRMSQREVVMARLQIGHTLATHSYLLKGEDTPICTPHAKEPYVAYKYVQILNWRDNTPTYF